MPEPRKLRNEAKDNRAIIAALEAQLGGEPAPARFGPQRGAVWTDRGRVVTGRAGAESARRREILSDPIAPGPLVAGTTDAERREVRLQSERRRRPDPNVRPSVRDPRRGPIVPGPLVGGGTDADRRAIERILNTDYRPPPRPAPPLPDVRASRPVDIDFSSEERDRLRRREASAARREPGTGPAVSSSELPSTLRYDPDMLAVILGRLFGDREGAPKAGRRSR